VLTVSLQSDLLVGETVKDITSTSFGLLIAFLLPGLVGLYSMSCWSRTLRKVFDTFLTVNSNLGLSVVVLLAALAVGLLVTAVRWVIFECWICKKDRFGPSDFEKLDDESKLLVFRAIVDEHYRYHQFWGGMCIVIPFLSIGMFQEYWTYLSALRAVMSLIFVVAVEIISGVAAREAFHNYVTRAKRILTIKP